MGIIWILTANTRLYMVSQNHTTPLHYTDTITLMKKNIFLKFFVKATF